MNPTEARRRSLLGLGAGVLAALPIAATADSRAQGARPMLSAADHGAKGDGTTDDSAALQAALDAAFAPNGPGFLSIPPGTYKVSRPLRVTVRSDITRHHGILAHGARLRSTIVGGADVLSFDSQATERFLLIEGLDILGGGYEGAGLSLQCESKEHYLYNFCLRDLAIQGCGGDGLRLMGDVFEGQIINSYFRDNLNNGATFGHGRQAGILSAIHVFGCVFGQNRQYGVQMINGCYDVAYHGCYFLLNARHGLVAANGCTLLSNCGFENNHEAAGDFSGGGPGIWLQGFGTLIGCTAYSMFKQTRLIEAYIAGQFTMIGCSGSGDGNARGAGLALIGGEHKGRATIVSPSGAVDYKNGFDALEIGDKDGGVRFGSDWQSPNLARLGDHRLWIDRKGRLRFKQGAPTSDEDGATVGS